MQSTPQNLGKLTSETTFGHSKVVFRPLLRTKRTFSQNPAMSRFWNFFGDTWHLFHTKKLDGSDGEFFFLNPRSRPMCDAVITFENLSLYMIASEHLIKPAYAASPECDIQENFDTNEYSNIFVSKIWH